MPKVARRNQARKVKGTSYTVPATITYLFGAGHVPTIGVLPDDVLLEIFYFCQAAPMDKMDHWWEKPEAVPRTWHTLVHVCQRW
jgi:hypothetical protein